MDFRKNNWYRLMSAASAKSELSLVGTFPFIDGEKGFVTYGISDNAISTQQWQIYPVEPSTFMLRTRAAGPDSYLATDTTNSSHPQAVPRIYNHTRTDSSMLWRIGPWGDGTFYFSNVAAGMASHLDFSGSGAVSMSTNITEPQPGQSFSFVRLVEIQDNAFSTVRMPPPGSSTSPFPTTTLSTSTTRESTILAQGLPTISSMSSVTSTIPTSSVPSKDSQNTPQLSLSAAIGIGAVVGVFAIISITSIGLLIYHRWNKRRSPETLHYRRAKQWKGFTPQTRSPKISDGLILDESKRVGRVWTTDLPIITPSTALATPSSVWSPPLSAGRHLSWQSWPAPTPTSPESPFGLQTPGAPPVEMPG